MHRRACQRSSNQLQSKADSSIESPAPHDTHHDTTSLCPNNAQGSSDFDLVPVLTSLVDLLVLNSICHGRRPPAPSPRTSCSLRCSTAALMASINKHIYPRSHDNTWPFPWTLDPYELAECVRFTRTPT